MASAPAEMAAIALPASPTPQIFTSGRRATLAGSVGAAPGGHERAHGRGRIAAPDQRLADERAVEPLRPPAGDRLGRSDPGLGDDEPVVRHELAEPARAVGVHLERPQVAVVDADQAGVGVDREPQLALVVGLHERLEPERQRPLDEVAQAALARMQDREQQDGVRAGEPQRLELARVDDELLGEDRDARRPRGRARRSSTEPPNQCGSHRTEIAAAPPAW